MVAEEATDGPMGPRMSGLGRHFSVGHHLTGRQVSQYGGYRCLKRRESGTPVRSFGH